MEASKSVRVLDPEEVIEAVTPHVQYAAIPETGALTDEQLSQLYFVHTQMDKGYRSLPSGEKLDYHCAFTYLTTMLDTLSRRHASPPEPAAPEGCSIIRNEVLADLYIKLSGKSTHSSDCATSVAPAETPGPCDCNTPTVTKLEYPEAPQDDAAVVEEMCREDYRVGRRVTFRALSAKEQAASITGMTAALTVARRGWIPRTEGTYTAAEVEKAIRYDPAVCSVFKLPRINAMVDRIRASLSALPKQQTKQERGQYLLAEWPDSGLVMCMKCGVVVLDQRKHNLLHKDILSFMPRELFNADKEAKSE
jgi:hypothetical protein